MIKKLENKDSKYAVEMAQIYNSANQLYPKEKRYVANEDIFLSQITNDQNFLYVQDENNRSIAFMSFNEQNGFFYELTSLYVEIESQRLGIGEKLLNFFESKIPSGSLVIVKALKDSPWAIQFYLKHNFKTIDNAIKEILEGCNIIEKPWSTILYKYID